MKKETIASLTIDGLVQTGEGGGTIDGKRILVRGVLPGETVQIRLSRDQQPTLIEIENPSTDRIEAPCRWVDACGGCTWQHVPREMQRDARLGQVRRALPSLHRDCAIEWFAAPQAYGYRTRARMAWSTVRRGVSLGFRSRGTHDVVDIPECVVLDPSLNGALVRLHEALAALPGKGEVSLARGKEGRPVVVLRAEQMPGPDGFRVPQRLVDAGFAGATLWPPDVSSSTDAGDPRPMVTGADGKPLWLAPDGFAQANEQLNSALAEYVTKASKSDGRTVLELYAGAGNFTVLLAKTAQKVTAVEMDRPASEALRSNLQTRGLTNVSVIQEDAVSIVADRKVDVVIMDPPRGGAREVAETIAKKPPNRLLYVSCDPPTFGRDLSILAASMDLESLAAFEMFPQTPHVELVGVLTRRRVRAA